MATPYPISLFRPLTDDALDATPASGAVVSCDACDQPIEGEPAGEGVYLWTRGDEVRYEKAPLCEQCAMVIGIAAMAGFEIEEEDGLRRLVRKPLASDRQGAASSRDAQGSALIRDRWQRARG